MEELKPASNTPILEGSTTISERPGGMVWPNLCEFDWAEEREDMIFLSPQTISYPRATIKEDNF